MANFVAQRDRGGIVRKKFEDDLPEIQKPKAVKRWLTAMWDQGHKVVFQGYNYERRPNDPEVLVLTRDNSRKVAVGFTVRFDCYNEGPPLTWFQRAMSRPALKRQLAMVGRC